MAKRVFAQTDTAADNGFTVGCSGLTAGSVTGSSEMTEGGTAGTTELDVDPGVNQAERACVSFQTDAGEPSNTYWNAGDWTVRLDITKLNMDMQWRSTYICERTSGGSFNLIASLTGQTTSLAALGTVTHTVTQTSNYKPASGSTIVIIIGIFFNDTMGNTTVGITPSLNTDSPIGVPVTVQESGGDYSSLEAAIEAATPEVSININGTWTADDTITGVGNTITVSAGNGTVVVADADSRNTGFPHTGTGSWYRLRKNASGHVFTISDSITLFGLDIEHEGDAASDEFFRSNGANSRLCEIDSCVIGYDAVNGVGSSDIYYTDSGIATHDIRWTNSIFYNADRSGIYYANSNIQAGTIDLNCCSFFNMAGSSAGGFRGVLNLQYPGGSTVCSVFNSFFHMEGANEPFWVWITESTTESITVDRSITSHSAWTEDFSSSTVTDSLLSRTWTDNASPGAGDWVVCEDVTTTPYDLRLLDSSENDAQDVHADGSGAGLTMPSVDIIGTSRPQNTNHDIGAFEIAVAGAVGHDYLASFHGRRVRNALARR